MPDQDRRADDSVTTGELGRRIEKIEDRIDRFEQMTSEHFRVLHDQIAALRFVPLDLYLSERDTLRGEVDKASRLGMWALGLMCSIVLGSVILGIVGMSGALSS